MPTPALDQPLTAGLDLGSTSVKLLVVDASGEQVAVAQEPTPWQAGDGGTAEIHAADLMRAVRTLFARVTEAIAPARLAAIGISGMGETGMLIDADGTAVAAGFAWFDPRGAEQAAAFPADVREEFSGRTGLPLGPQVTVSKLALLRDNGIPLAGRRWLNLPEYVAAALGGEIALEYSLLSRTGLLDQDTGEAWPAMLCALGVDETFLPPARHAGESWGTAADGLGPAVAGARLTVAGHDHLVAATADGPLPLDEYHVSMGTAEVLLRVLEQPLGYDARHRLAAALINEVRHTEPGRHVLVAGVKSGLVLRRALQALGVSDRAGRDALDAEVMGLPYEGRLPADAIEVTGARNDDGVLRVALHTDAISPAEVFGAVLRHSNDEIELLIEAMDREVPPAVRAVLTGGWVGMASVRRARDRILPDLSVSHRELDTAYGAASAARRLIAS